jgi:hypothetical protein
MFCTLTMNMDTILELRSQFQAGHIYIYIFIYLGSRGRVVASVTGLRLDGRGTVTAYLTGVRDFSQLQNIKTGSVPLHSPTRWTLEDEL